MLKIVDPSSFRFDEPICTFVKQSSRGLVGDDLTRFIKRASHGFLSSLDKLRPGEVPVHALAVGATEYYGANRNGDGFKKATCRSQHPTFVKYAKYFRNHENKPHEGHHHYGRIVDSAYNEDMHRIEILLGLYKDAKVAEEYGGSLGRAADKEQEKLASGKDIPVSMSCKLAFDICSFCGNEATSKEEYCDTTPWTNKRGKLIEPCSGFGARYGLTKVASDGCMQYVENPNCTFFDLSGVYRNADRLAFVLGLLEKAAGALVLSGADLADRWGVTDDFLIGQSGSAKIASQLRYLVELSRIEQNSKPSPFDACVVKSASVSPLSPPYILKDAGTEVPAVCRALADAGVCLDHRDWLELVAGKEAAASVADDLGTHLPGVFSRLLNEPDIQDRLGDNLYLAGHRQPDISLRDWAEKLAADRGVRPRETNDRFNRAILRGTELPQLRPLIKTAGVDPGLDGLARHYALYQVAYLAAQPADSHDIHLTETLLVRRNAVA